MKAMTLYKYLKDDKIREVIILTVGSIELFNNRFVMLNF